MDVKEALERAIQDVSDHDAKLVLQQHLLETFGDGAAPSPGDDPPVSE